MPVFMPHWPKPLGKRPIDLGLERVTKVLDRLDNPENLLPPVIHVAGTNGKGSTIAFLSSILTNSGYSVNCYTSPHLFHFNERIKICNQEIKDKDLYQYLEDVRLATKEEKITFFEGTTIAAILAFSKTNADFCIIETGMGGRLDATNIFKNPLLTVITSIDYDHTEYLGNTLKKIAYEKAGIMKTSCTCIIADQKKEVICELERNAILKKVPVFRSGFEWKTEICKDGFYFCYDDKKCLFNSPSLAGDHQINNVGNAIAAAILLSNKFAYQDISHKVTNLAIKNTKWPARLQQIKNNRLVKKLPANFKLFLDGAHNSAGAKTISKWLGKKTAHFIVGMTREKDTASFLSILKNNIKSLYAVCVKSEPRSQTVQEIKNQASNCNIDCKMCDCLEDAIDLISKRPDNKNTTDSTVIVCGSLFLAKDIKSYDL